MDDEWSSKPECHVVTTSCLVEPLDLEILPCFQRLIRSCNPIRLHIHRVCQCNGQDVNRPVPGHCSYHGGNSYLTSCDEVIPNLGVESASVARAAGRFVKNDQIPGSGVFIHIPDSVMRVPARHERLCSLARHIHDIADHGGYIDFAQTFSWRSKQGAMYTRRNRPFHRGSGFTEEKKLCHHNNTSLGDWFDTIIRLDDKSEYKSVSWSSGLFAVQMNRIQAHSSELYERLSEDLVSYGTFSENSHFAERIWMTLWRGDATLYATVEEAHSLNVIVITFCVVVSVIAMIAGMIHKRRNYRDH